MTSGILSGFGQFSASILTNTALPEFMFLEPLAFSIDGTAGNVEASKYVNGVIVTSGVKKNKQTFKMKIGIEAVSFTALQFALGRKAAAPAAITLPEIRYGTVPLAAPYEITNPAITTSTAIAQAFVVGRGAWGGEGKLINTVAATANPGEVKVDAAAGKLIFNAAQAGAPIAYRVYAPIANVPTVGAVVTQAFELFEFAAIAYGGDGELFAVKVPKAQVTSAPSVNISEVTKLELEFQLIQQAGAGLPFEVSQLPANYALV